MKKLLLLSLVFAGCENYTYQESNNFNDSTSTIEYNNIGVGMTYDRKFGTHLGGGIIMTYDGKIGFGYGF